LIGSPSNKRPRITQKGKKPLQPLLVSPIHSHNGIHLGELTSANKFENACKEYLKQGEEGSHDHVTLLWEPQLPFPSKLSLALFNLVPYMLRKYNWLSNSIDDFNKEGFLGFLAGWR